MIKIVVNGKDQAVPLDTNIGNLISQLRIGPQLCVVELNREIVGRDNYCVRKLEDGDEVEIIRFMAGG